MCRIASTGVTGLTRNDYGAVGKYPVVGNGRFPRGLHDEYNVPEMTIIVSRTGAYGNVSRYEQKVMLTDESFYLTDVASGVDSDYLYFQLKTILQQKLQAGRYRNPSLKKERLEDLYVYVPEIEEQRELTAVLMDLDALPQSNGIVGSDVVDDMFCILNRSNGRIHTALQACAAKRRRPSMISRIAGGIYWTIKEIILVFMIVAMSVTGLLLLNEAAGVGVAVWHERDTYMCSICALVQRVRLQL